MTKEERFKKVTQAKLLLETAAERALGQVQADDDDGTVEGYVALAVTFVSNAHDLLSEVLDSE